MKTIAITGSGGYLGTNLIANILQTTNWNVVAFSSKPAIQVMPINEDVERLIVVSNEDMNSYFETHRIDIVVHVAFSRRFNTVTQIAQSINFSEHVYKLCHIYNCKLINISTVGVYGQSKDFLNENSVVAPDSLYSMAKYASEVLLYSIYGENTGLATNIRLSGIAQSQKILPTFIENAKSNQIINIIGGTQQFSWIDIDDATEAIILLLKKEEPWDFIYNVSLDECRYSIIEIAEMVANEAEKFGYKRPKIKINPSDLTVCVGWSSKKFMNFTGWIPKISINETISKMFN